MKVLIIVVVIFDFFKIFLSDDSRAGTDDTEEAEEKSHIKELVTNNTGI